jgi:Capsule polysaccharide export protein
MQTRPRTLHGPVPLMTDHQILPQTDPVLPAGEPRRVMLLQGLMGSFFRRLGIALRKAGHEVFKVNFNGGDKAYWRLPNGIDYRGTLAEWPESFARLLEKHRISDVMLFGDCRDHHMAALKVCRERGVTVWVFEEGYVRPDWVTMEVGGVNGHSYLAARSAVVPRHSRRIAARARASESTVLIPPPRERGALVQRRGRALPLALSRLAQPPAMASRGRRRGMGAQTQPATGA